MTTHVLCECGSELHVRFSAKYTPEQIAADPEKAEQLYRATVAELGSWTCPSCGISFLEEDNAADVQVFEAVG